jgi:DNA polymerase-4
VSTTLTLTEIAEQLVWQALAEHRDRPEISLLAISVSNLVDQPVLQLELPVAPGGDEADEVRPGSAVGSARWAVDTSIDAIRRKFGRDAVGYTSTALSDAASVPDEFRELAEHEL